MENDPVITEIAPLFGAIGAPALLTGGQGSTWKAGPIILKPTSDPEESEGLASLMEEMPVVAGIRLPRPIRSKNANWVEGNYVAWSFLNGAESGGRYQEKLEVCDIFNAAFANVREPDFLKKRNDPWAIADRVTWGEASQEYAGVFQNMIDHVKTRLQPVSLPNQIIHGDISGNIVFAKGQSPGVIDLTLYWRPADFSKALLVVDAITWQGADPAIYGYVQHLRDVEQLILRAGLRRILENPEQIRAFDKDPKAAVDLAQRYYATLKALVL